MQVRCGGWNADTHDLQIFKSIEYMNTEHDSMSSKCECDVF